MRVKPIYRPVGKFCYSNGMEATQIKILDAAEQRIRTAGYHGFSFREIAADVGIKSSSVHHYFPTKELLGVAVARRYTDRFFAALPAEPLEPQTALRKAFLRAIESDGRVCLCGALASGAGSLPPSVAAEARRFFEESLRYLSKRTDQRGTARLLLDKIPCASEINNLRNFLRVAFWYEFEPCSTSCAFGLASSIGSFTLANPC